MPVMRDGGDKIVKLAQALILITQKFAGILKAKFPPPSPISALIDAILALSVLLPAAEGQVFDYGGQNEPVEADPNDVQGQGLTRPPQPEEPDYGE